MSQYCGHRDNSYNRAEQEGKLEEICEGWKIIKNSPRRDYYTKEMRPVKFTYLHTGCTRPSKFSPHHAGVTWGRGSENQTKKRVMCLDCPAILDQDIYKAVNLLNKLSTT